MRLVSWNVNGIRAILSKKFEQSIDKMKPDVLCLQETKAHPDQVDKMLDEFPHHFWSSAEKKGYAGTAIFSKVKPINVTEGMGVKEFDMEGRILTAEYDNFFLVTVYVPNAQHELLRLEWKRKWNKAFLDYLMKLEKNKPVVYCGDLNVAHTEKDIARPKDNTKNPGFTPEEREDFTTQLDSGFVDVWREQHLEEIKYSWWSYRFNARARNIGWRIDYFVASKKLMPKINDSKIHTDIIGSDHCPVSVDIQVQ
ncbi:MAG: exodeoxyribonuclease III [Candidatus Woesearchaeota archaeon]